MGTALSLGIAILQTDWTKAGDIDVGLVLDWRRGRVYARLSYFLFQGRGSRTR